MTTKTSQKDEEQLSRLTESGQLDQFVKPIQTREYEKTLVQEFEKEVSKRYTCALVVGRFQLLHRGHMMLFKYANAVSEKGILIGIGSANVRDRDNPFSAKQRENMIRKALVEEGLAPRLQDIVYINDYNNDELWLSETRKKTGGKFDVAIGNNDWVNGIFEKAGIETLRIPLYFRKKLMARKLREKYLYPTLYPKLGLLPPV